MKLSVIVPVYNTEQYLRQCIDSIICQTYKNIEIILVDDGSDDGSGKICDEYAQRFDNIKVVHKRNNGVIAAKQSGVRKAEGEYVGFVDSDDWISEDMYEILIRAAEKEKIDIVSMNGYVICEKTKQYPKEDATMTGTYTDSGSRDVLYSKMIYDENMGTRGITPSLGNKIIRKRIFERVVEGTEEGITLGEDAALFYPCCLMAESIKILRGCKYYYRIREESMCHLQGTENFNKIYIFYEYLKRKFQNSDDQYGLVQQLRKYLWYFLSGQMEEIYELEIKKTYLFPYQSVQRGSCIILYGAGRVGKSYYEQIIKSGYCDIAAWVDRRGNIENRRILAPSKIAEFEYSQIVVAVKELNYAMEIISELLELGVEKEKILWTEPLDMALV